MGRINISNSRGRDAAVTTESVSRGVKMRWIDTHGSAAETKKILKGTMDRDLDAMLAKYGDVENLTQALITEDPEIDIETYGSFLKNTARGKSFIGSSKRKSLKTPTAANERSDLAKCPNRTWRRKFR